MRWYCSRSRPGLGYRLDHPLISRGEMLYRGHTPSSMSGKAMDSTRRPPRLFHLFFVVALLLSLVPATLISPPVAEAATTHYVTNCTNDDAGSLRSVIGYAASGDTIEFAFTVHCPTIDLFGVPLSIDKALTINGPGANLLTIRRSGASLRVMDVTVAGTLYLSGVTMAGWSATIPVLRPTLITVAVDQHHQHGTAPDPLDDLAGL